MQPNRPCPIHISNHSILHTPTASILRDVQVQLTQSKNSGADKYRIRTGDPEKRQGPLAASQEPPAPIRPKDSCFPSSMYDEAVDRFFLNAKPRQEAEVLRVGPKSTQVLRV